MIRTSKIVWLMLLFSAGAAMAGQKPLDPEEILKRVDDVRNPPASYEMKVRIGENRFEVWLDGNSRTLVRTLEPSRDRGRDLLMLGEEMWAYIPNLKRAVRVSLAQRLTGQAANGDISRMRWSGDYQPVLESESSESWVLLLEARKKGLTYERIRVRVKKTSFHPMDAEYLTPALKPLKRAVFENFRSIAGAIRPTILRITSAVNANDSSLIEVESMQSRRFDAGLFNPQRLGQ